MAKAISWSSQMDEQLEGMRSRGESVNRIAKVMKISKNAIINRLDGLRLKTGAAFRAEHGVPTETGRLNVPLPPGSPETWGLISGGKPWPGKDAYYV